MIAGVVVFPGSNCDLDAYHLVRDVLKHDVYYIRYDSEELGSCDLVILPGGFTYGDYLRSGAIASFSPIMEAVKKFARNGGLVLGICNGFQVLTEAGLLPGALYRNDHLQFRCERGFVRIENTKTPFTNQSEKSMVLNIPIAHGDGNYYLGRDELALLEERNQVIMRYCDNNGQVSQSSNPNGSVNNIAGICNQQGNVAGMMPHPERAGESALGSEDGLVIFKSILDHLSRREVDNND